ncbi:MAG: transcriptional repressor [Acidobacteria bacterium]|nr:transcriptional repressor [Acidobacteriota bacterium]
MSGSETVKEFQVERDIFSDYIQSRGLRHTGQRDLILQTFLSTEEHLTSEDLYGLVSKIDPTLGLTTVYRTLKLLTEAGLAREVRFGDNKTYYEHHFNHEHHDHMICTECGKVIEFFSPDIEALQDEMADKFGFRPTHHSLRLWGLCSECQAGNLISEPAAPGAQPRVRVRTAMH